MGRLFMGGLLMSMLFVHGFNMGWLLMSMLLVHGLLVGRFLVSVHLMDGLNMDWLLVNWLGLGCIFAQKRNKLR